MLVKSSVSVFLVLVVSQVSCQRIKVEDVVKPDNLQDHFFKDVQDTQAEQVRDLEAKGMILDEQKDHINIKYWGVQVSFGDEVEKPSTEETASSSSTVTCLDVNKSVIFSSPYSSDELFQSRFHISFDSGPSVTHTSYSAESSKIENGKLCFLFGYSYPFKGSKDKTIHFYLNFLKDMTELVGKTIHSLYVIRTKEDSYIQYYGQNQPLNRTNANPFQNNYSVEVNFSKCITNENEKLAFALDGNNYSFSGEKKFEMVFFEQKPEKQKTDQAILQRKKTYPTLKCVNDFVDGLLSKDSKTENLEQYRTEERYII